MKKSVLAVALMLGVIGCSHAKNSPPSGDAGCNEVSCSIKLPLLPQQKLSRTLFRKTIGNLLYPRVGCRYNSIPTPLLR